MQNHAQMRYAKRQSFDEILLFLAALPAHEMVVKAQRQPAC